MRNKRFLTGILAGYFILSMSFTSLAGQWIQDENGWKYQGDDGNYANTLTRWIDGNGDGIYEEYVFKSSGYMAVAQDSDDYLTINNDGATMEDGKVKTLDLAELKRKIDTGFIKSDIVNLIDCNEAEVNRVLGEPVKEWYPMFDYDYSKIYHGNSGNELTVYYKNGKFGTITGRLGDICNIEKGYTLDEIDAITGIKGDIDTPVSIWKYSYSPLVRFIIATGRNNSVKADDPFTFEASLYSYYNIGGSGNN